MTRYFVAFILAILFGTFLRPGVLIIVTLVCGWAIWSGIFGEFFRKLSYFLSLNQNISDKWLGPEVLILFILTQWIAFATCVYQTEVISFLNTYIFRIPLNYK